MDEAHTYFVGDGQWLVHNVCDLPNKKSSTDDTNPQRPTLNPNDIRYSQDSIRPTFQDNRSIDELREGLANGTITPEQIPPIRVVLYNGHYYTLDNRRLWAFRESGQYDSIEVILEDLNNPHIAKEFKDKYTTITNGDTIRIRNGR